MIDPAAYLSCRIDASPAAGVQEFKEWMALQKFLGKAFPDGIDKDAYGTGGYALGRIY